MSKRKELVDCFNCSAAGSACDRTRHRCVTCLQTTDVCRGYPRDLQWLSGVKSRGKEKGKLLSVEASKGEWQSTTPINHAFIFKQGKPRKKRPQQPRKLNAASLRQASSPKDRAIIESNESHEYGLTEIELEDDMLSVELRDSAWAGSDAASEGLSDIFGSFFNEPSHALSPQSSVVDNTSSLMLQPPGGRQDVEQFDIEISVNCQDAILSSHFLLPSLESSTLLAWCKIFQFFLRVILS